MTKFNQRSFSSGEISPQLWGRVDLDQYKNGLAVMRNFFVDYRGGATTRAGTALVGRARVDTGTVRLIPFQFSTLQTYVLEFGQNYLRIITNGAYITNTPQNLLAVDLSGPNAKFTFSGPFNVSSDTIFFAGIGGTTQVNDNLYIVAVQTGTNQYILADQSGNAVTSASLSPFTSSGTAASIYVVGTPYAASDLALLKFTQSADTLTLVHPAYLPQDLVRQGETDWVFNPLNFASTISAPMGLAGYGYITNVVQNQPLYSASFSYQVTAVDNMGQESLPSVPVYLTQVPDIASESGYIQLTWDPVPGADYYNVYKATPVQSGGQAYPTVATATPQSVPAGASYGFAGNTYGTEFIDNNITPDFTQTPPQHANPFALSPIIEVDVTNGGALNPNASPPGGGYKTTDQLILSDPTGTGAVLQPVIINGYFSSVIIIEGGEGYTNPTFTVKAADGSAPIGTGAAFSAKIGPATGTYPGVTTYFQQRKTYAASYSYPDTVWMSKPGQFYNFDVSIPSIASDALQLSLVSNRVDAIKFMVPMPGGLVTLTANGAWQLSGGNSQSNAISPQTADAEPQCFNGCADVPPIVVNENILYVQSKGSIVRNLEYNYFTRIYTGIDMSVLSNHLFNPRSIKEWAYQEEPFKIIWCVRDDGVLLSFTYLKDQQVNGWARHDTQGLVESIAVVQEGIEDAVYLSVKRYIGGSWKRYIERMQSRVLPNGIYSAWAVDCGLNITGQEVQNTLQMSGTSGIVTATLPGGLFNGSFLNGWIIAGQGVGLITAISADNTTATVNLIQPMTEFPFLQEPPIFAVGDWTFYYQTTQVSGLSHLNGQTVSILADGIVQPQQVVKNGTITLASPAHQVIVGLGFQAQLQTLMLDTGEPSTQGSRKQLSRLTVKVSQTTGIKCGSSFATIRPYLEQQGSATIYTGNLRQFVLDPKWQEQAQMCIQVDDPVPATITGIIPDVAIGDTAK